ncbi:arginine--tRNA ligase [Picrophilus oshimae]|uniref:Arginine--tRNA ligase n=1 Tax=Picrophilus torridus (strain ATCC 700027 / DSM 9790 / JCM 10055 / NBRC 100828 / KAW 2/3) TaxID=1122961 RepID=Q6L1G4_PICTO|nr:arginine--tRNA ligase [Picrophilus oshimae]AAT43188.1 arginyl-tRNA synthetase [Picrophilus oshimae DSM 9789]
MLLFDDYKRQLITKLNSVYKIEDKDAEINTEHGDISIRLFRIKDDPEVIKNNIYNILKKEAYIERFEINGRYLNIWLKTRLMFDILLDAFDRLGTYPDVFQDAEKALVEHTSANPTGPIHIGRTRNSIIGDSIARIIERTGMRVMTQYYVNDSGKQVLYLYIGYEKFHKNEEPTVENLLDGYQKIYNNIDESIENEVSELSRLYEKGDTETIKKIQNIAGIVLSSIMESLKKIDVNIMSYVWESSFIINGSTSRVMSMLENSIKNDGDAKYIEYNGRKIYLTRSDGTSLYFVRDIAYHLYKAGDYDFIIDVLGEDHKEHARNLEYVLKDLLDFNANLRFVFYDFISLESGKMSTRKGNIVTLDELYNKTVDESIKIVKEKRPEYSEEKAREIAVAIASSSIRFNISKVNQNKPMTFRWSEALNFEGDSAPYIMYAYARAKSIIRKISENNTGELNDFNDYERSLIKDMFLYPYYLKSAFENLRPDIIANYLLLLVKSFNDFYMKCPVIGSDQIYKRSKIIEIFIKIMEDAAPLVGIKLLDEI